MKKILTIAIGLSFATAAVHAQNLADYQSTTTGLSPSYYNSLDNSLTTPTVGTATFTGTGTSFTSDYFGNANDAVSFSGSTVPSPNALNQSAGADIIANNTIGSLSLLFYMPAGTPGTQYIFSDGEATTATGSETAGTAFALDFSSGAFQLKTGNTSASLASTLGTPAGGSWYYFAATWNTTVASGATAVTAYLGVAGSGTLLSGTIGKSSGGTTGAHINSTAVMGDGLGFVLGNRQTQNGSGQAAGFNIGGTAPGADDELAIWNGTVLTSGQITSQFNTLVIPAPEPSTFAMLGIGGLTMLLWARRFACFGAK
jgi:hypothetical protein